MTVDQDTRQHIKDEVFRALARVIDPEVGVNVVDLGLVYDVTVQNALVAIAMTMTTPACPMSNHLVAEAHESVTAVLDPGYALDIKLVWEPRWHPRMMSDKARMLLGWQ